MEWKAIIMICALLVPSTVTSCSSGPSRPPAVSFRPQNIPPVHRTTRQMKREVRIVQDYLPARHAARRKARSMRPQFITIHSTANPTGDAAAHAKALKRSSGRMAVLDWHFTVDQYWAIQHIPLNETGRHADKGGPGDMYSIAIEMGEVRSHSPIKVYDKTAKLTACLMKDYNIPLRNVVPHYYWSGKNCPRPLLDNGRPGYKWSWFISRVDYYYRCLNTPPPQPKQPQQQQMARTAPTGNQPPVNVRVY